MDKPRILTLKRVVKEGNREVIKGRTKKNRPAGQAFLFVKRCFDTVFRTLMVLVLTAGFALFAFMWMAYNGKSTPFENIYIMNLNDNVQELAGQITRIGDEGLFKTVDSLRKKVVVLEKSVAGLEVKVKAKS